MQQLSSLPQSEMVWHWKRVFTQISDFCLLVWLYISKLIICYLTLPSISTQSISMNHCDQSFKAVLKVGRHLSEKLLQVDMNANVFARIFLDKLSECIIIVFFFFCLAHEEKKEIVRLNHLL